MILPGQWFLYFLNRNFAGSGDVFDTWEDKEGYDVQKEKCDSSGKGFREEKGLDSYLMHAKSENLPRAIALRVEVVIEQGHGTKVLDSGQIRVDASLSFPGTKFVLYLRG